MTLVVGFRFADEVIIGADSRRIEQNTGIEHDDTEKVFDCTLGLVAAAGELNTIHLIVGAICIAGDSPAEAVGPTLERLVPDANDAARRDTQWLATSAAADGDGTEVNLSLITSSNNLQPVAVAASDYEILYPPGLTAAQKRGVEAALDTALADAVAAEDADDRRQIVMNAIYAAIVTVSPLTIGVSTRIQVGTHDVGGTIRISNVADNLAHLVFPDDEL